MWRRSRVRTHRMSCGTFQALVTGSQIASQQKQRISFRRFRDVGGQERIRPLWRYDTRSEDSIGRLLLTNSL